MDWLKVARTHIRRIPFWNFSLLSDESLISKRIFVTGEYGLLNGDRKIPKIEILETSAIPELYQ